MAGDQMAEVIGVDTGSSYSQRSAHQRAIKYRGKREIVYTAGVHGDGCDEIHRSIVWHEDAVGPKIMAAGAAQSAGIPRIQNVRLAFGEEHQVQVGQPVRPHSLLAHLIQWTEAQRAF